MQHDVRLRSLNLYCLLQEQHNINTSTEYNSTIGGQSFGTPYSLHRIDLTLRANNDPVPPPPLELNIDSYMVLEAWHGFQPQLVEPSMKNFVLLFRHEYSVSGHRDSKS